MVDVIGEIDDVPENFPSNEEIIKIIKGYLESRPDVAGAVKNIHSAEKLDIQEEPMIETARASFLPFKQATEQSLFAGEGKIKNTILGSLPASPNGTVTCVAEKNIKRDGDGQLIHEMFSLHLRKPPHQEDATFEEVGSFWLSFFNNENASDEDTPISSADEDDYFNTTKKVVKIRRRFVDPKYRSEGGIGTNLLHGTEAFVQEYANDAQHDVSIITTGAQLDVFKFFLKNGYEVVEKDKPRMLEIIDFMKKDMRGEEHPRLRRSVSSYVVPKKVSEAEFLIDPQKPYAGGVAIDLTRDAPGREGSAITFIKRIAANKNNKKPASAEAIAGKIASSVQKSLQSAWTE